MSTRYVALLRGINVGGHRVAMAELRTHMAALGLVDVSTVIARTLAAHETERDLFAVHGRELCWLVRGVKGDGDTVKVTLTFRSMWCLPRRVNRCELMR